MTEDTSVPPRSRRSTERHERLDLLRGVATLGIFAMNAVSFPYVAAGYTNPSAAGIAGWWDVLIGLTGEMLFDQKMMGMFSLLFGASLVLFVEWQRDTRHIRAA